MKKHNTFMQNQLQTKNFDWINMQNSEYLHELLQRLTHDTKPDQLQQLGAQLFEKEIAFSKVAIFLDQYIHTLAKEEQTTFIQNRNHFAKGYLTKRLPQEIAILKKSIHNNPSLISKEDIAIIDELLEWLEELINAFLDKNEAPTISKRFDAFKKYVDNSQTLFFEDKEIKKHFLHTNHELYNCAQEALNFFKQKEYYYFLLCYGDLIANFLKMTTLLGSMFLENELFSIYIDPVTMLPNRFQLIKDFGHFSDVYLLIVNIKSFSKLNILYGFEEGDRILKLIAQHLKTSCAIKSYRIYGDEFALLLSSKEEIEELFSKLNEELSVVIDDTKYDITFYGAFDRFEDKALEGCEFALAKGDKRGLVDSSHIKSLIQNYQDELSMMQKLKEAMIKDEIIPYYQPIYSQQEHGVIKYEVLMRVKYNDEILSPAQFLPTLLEAPFYTEFTKSILLKSFEMFRNTSLTFSINLTITDLKDKNFLLFLHTLIKKYPDTAKRLTLEITETQALQEFDLLNDFIAQMRPYGITFSLDDFGSGYSNFAQVAKLDIDYIKIDGSIIKELLEDEKLQKLLESIVNFAKSFHLKVIAEYVSNKELFDYLKNRVDMLQGYYIGKPEPILQEAYCPLPTARRS